MCIHGDKSQPERDWVLNGEFKAEHRPYSVSQIGRLSVKDHVVNVFGFVDQVVVHITLFTSAVRAQKWP